VSDTLELDDDAERALIAGALNPEPVRGFYKCFRHQCTQRDDFTVRRRKTSMLSVGDHLDTCPTLRRINA
jgi:hypothetical protein